MTRSAKSRVVAGALLAAAVMALTAATVAGDAGAESVHPSGLVLVGKAADQEQIPDAVSDALGRAERLAEQNPRDFGYAWFDRDENSVVLDVVSSRGARMAEALEGAGADDGDAGARSVRTVERSQSMLEQLKHDVIDISGEPAFDGDAIWQSEVDRKNNRVIVTVTRLSDALAAELVRRYGRSAVAVRIDRDRPDVAPLPRAAGTSRF